MERVFYPGSSFQVASLELLFDVQGRELLLKTDHISPIIAMYSVAFHELSLPCSMDTDYSSFSEDVNCTSVPRDGRP